MTTSQLSDSEFVIIGGGAVGCGVAYALAKAGRRDILVLERVTELGSITTSQGARERKWYAGPGAEMKMEMKMGRGSILTRPQNVAIRAASSFQFRLLSIQLIPFLFPHSPDPAQMAKTRRWSNDQVGCNRDNAQNRQRPQER